MATGTVLAGKTRKGAQMPDSAHICKAALTTGECPYDVDNPVKCTRCSDVYLPLKGAERPVVYMCRDCKERDKVNAGLAACNGDKLAEAKFWFAYQGHNWRYSCGDPIHNVDVAWLIAEVERARAKVVLSVTECSDCGCNDHGIFCDADVYAWPMVRGTPNNCPLRAGDIVLHLKKEVI